jgi:hypothetical protein
MPFKPDPDAMISSAELANRDATYMIVRFIQRYGPNRRESSTFGLSTSGNGRHAEEDFVYWCGKPENRAALRQAFESGGRILELLLTKSPCPKCTKLLIELATKLNSLESKCGLDMMWITLVGMYKGINDSASQASLRLLHGQEPLIYLFIWSGRNADLFDPTDQVLFNNIANFDDQAPPSRQGTDVVARVGALHRYFKTGLGIDYEDAARIRTH